jgi:radical SAM enzyme (TIGR01210 family)
MEARSTKRQTPVAVWTERELLDGEKVEALVIILRSGGCSWSRNSGCLMCGYSNDCLSTVTPEDLVSQFEHAMSQQGNLPYIKIYTSGSFFDPGEVPIDARETILKTAGEKAGRVLVESRPEFVTNEFLGAAKKHVKSLEVAIGLETTDDEIRERCVNKGFDFSDYMRASNVLSECGTANRTYLLLKPPYLTEGKAVEDVKNSIKKIDGIADTISVNPVNVQRGTPVEKLWKKSHYRPPWLWSLLEALKTPSGARLVSVPSGGGTRRGAHNCGNCDKAFLNALNDFNLNADSAIFDEISCECREEWLDSLDLEVFAGSSGDLARLMRP